MAEPNANLSATFTRDELKALVLGTELISGRMTDFVTVLYVLVSVVGVFGNGLVCYVFIKQQSMRNARNAFIMNLAIADLILSATLIPFIRYRYLIKEWTYGDGMCKFFNAFTGTNIFCSTLTIIAIAADRYFCITNPTPGQVLQRKHVILIIFAIWICALMFNVPFLIFYAAVPNTLNLNELRSQFNIRVIGLENANSSILHICEFCRFDVADPFKRFMRIFEWLFLLPVPLFALIVFNLRLHAFLKSNNSRREYIVSRTRAHSINKGNDKPNLLVPTVYNGQRRNSHESVVEVFQQKSKRSKTTILLFLMTFSYAFLWFPFTVMSWVDFPKMGQLWNVNPWTLFQIDSLFILLAQTSTAVNPILYAYFNTNFNREFKIIFDGVIQLCCRRSCCFLPGTNTETVSAHHMTSSNNGPVASVQHAGSRVNAVGPIVRVDVDGGIEVDNVEVYKERTEGTLYSTFTYNNML